MKIHAEKELDNFRVEQKKRIDQMMKNSVLKRKQHKHFNKLIEEMDNLIVRVGKTSAAKAQQIRPAE